jgi:kumamolisin
VIFAPNTDQGFDDAINLAISLGCNGITISWGGAEDAWDPSSIDMFEASFDKARKAGIAVFAAAGDSGSKDSESHNVTDYPASSPNVIGCGGTRLEVKADGSRASETVWNDSPTQSATGGGVSRVFPGRQVPDIAGNADPDSPATR